MSRIPRVWAKPHFQADRIHTRIINDPRDPIQKYGQFAAPFFHIDILNQNGNVLFSGSGYRDVSGTYDLQGLIIHSVSYEFTIDGADTLSITATNPDNQLQDSNIFRHHNTVDLWFGYDGHTPIYMGRGIMVEIESNFTATGEPTIRATCYDISYFMMEEGKAEIVPEGSTWWERRRAPPPPMCQPINSPDLVEDSVPNSMNEVEEQSRNELRRMAREQGVDVEPSMIALTEALDQGRDLTGQQGTIHAARLNESSRTTVDPERSDGSVSVGDEDWSQLASNPVDFLEHYDPSTGEVSEEITNPYSEGPSTRAGILASGAQMTWQRHRFPRRSRNAGHVWKGRTDSEIVIEIFFSYGIVPYVQDTNESRSARRQAVDPCASSGTRTEGGELVTDAVADDGQLERSASERRRQNLELEAQGSSLRVDEEGLSQSIDNGVEMTGETGVIHQDIIRSTQLGVTSIDGSDERSWFGRHDYSEDLLDVYQNVVGFDPVFGVDPGPLRQNVTQASTTPPTREPPREREVTQKVGTTDWEFISKMAKQHGFIVFVFYDIVGRDWIGYWGPEENVPQYREYTFSYNDGDNGSIGDSKANISSRDQSTEIDLIYVDPVSGRTNRLRVAIDGLSEYTQEFRGQYGPIPRTDPVGNGPEVTLMVYGQRVRTMADRRFTSIEDARRWLMAYWIEHAEDFFVLDGETIIGIPELRGREHHKFGGLGRFSGRFFITSATHAMSPGTKYSTKFVARRERPWQPNQSDADSDLMTIESNEIGRSSSSGEDRTPG